MLLELVCPVETQESTFGHLYIAGNRTLQVMEEMHVHVMQLGQCPFHHFIETDYFCESGNPGQSTENILYEDDPLWDGDNCIATSTCCTFSNPPFFTQNVTPTNDSLDARICIRRSRENILVEFIELYVK